MTKKLKFARKREAKPKKRLGKPFLILMCCFFFFLGVIIYAFGFHNVDIGWNMKSLECRGFNVVDTSIWGGVTRNANEAYSFGMTMIYFGVIFTVLITIIIGYALGLIEGEGGGR